LYARLGRRGPSPATACSAHHPIRAPRPAGPQPRDGLQRAPPIRTPRPAGPQPRDGLQRAPPNACYFSSKSTVAVAFVATASSRVTVLGASYSIRPSLSAPLGRKPACHIVTL